MRCLTPHLREALHRGHDRKNEHDPENWDQQNREEKADAEEDDSLGAFHDATFGIKAKCFGLCPLIGNDERSTEHCHRQQWHEATVGVGEIPSDTAQQHRVGNAVGHGVEKRSSRTGGSSGFRNCAIKRIGETGENEEQQSEGQETGRNRHRGAGRHHDTDSGQAIGSEAKFEQLRSDWLQAFFNIRTPTTVKHTERLAVGPSSTPARPYSAAMADYTTLMPADAVVALRTLPRRMTAALGVVDEATEGRAHQLSVDGVSAVEVILGATATLAVLEKGLSDVSKVDDAPLHPAVTNRQLRSVEVSTSEPTEAVLEQFTDRVTSLANLAESIKGHDWSRTGTIGDEKRSALDLLREAVGAGVEALTQVERIISSLD